jgi:uncharacterized protein
MYFKTGKLTNYFKNCINFYFGIFILTFVIIISGCSFLMHYGESKFLSTAPNGKETPADFGIPFERFNIQSEERSLDSYIIQASSDSGSKIALLIFHGAGETISNWTRAQKILYDNGISSIVFDYSGHGNSTKPGTISNLNTDAVSAYNFFSSHFKDHKKYVLGFSLGNAPMLSSVASFQPPPSGVVVASAFSSLKELGYYHNRNNCLKKMLISLIPDKWNNMESVKLNTQPLLVIHSDSDISNPLYMGESIYKSGNEPKEFYLHHNFKHNAPIYDTTGEWWKPVINFIKNDGKLRINNF